MQFVSKDTKKTESRISLLSARYSIFFHFYFQKKPQKYLEAFLHFS